MLAVQEALETLPGRRPDKPHLVYDHGSQFISRGWRTFVRLAGAADIRTRVCASRIGRAPRVPAPHASGGGIRSTKTSPTTRWALPRRRGGTSTTTTAGLIPHCATCGRWATIAAIPKRGWPSDDRSYSTPWSLVRCIGTARRLNFRPREGRIPQSISGPVCPTFKQAGQNHAGFKMNAVQKCPRPMMAIQRISRREEYPT
jgi:hypothetical protein